VGYYRLSDLGLGVCYFIKNNQIIQLLTENYVFNCTASVSGASCICETVAPLCRVRTDPGKVWKVLEFYVEIFKALITLENDHRYGKVWRNP